MTDLRYHYADGPEMIHNECGGEIITIDGGLICCKCSAQDDPTSRPEGAPAMTTDNPLAKEVQDRLALGMGLTADREILEGAGGIVPPGQVQEPPEPAEGHRPLPAITGLLNALGIKGKAVLPGPERVQGGPYTCHGHPVPGVTVMGNVSRVVARCGGPAMCKVCGPEAAQIRAKAEADERAIQDRLGDCLNGHHAWADSGRGPCTACGVPAPPLQYPTDVEWPCPRVHVGNTVEVGFSRTVVNPGRGIVRAVSANGEGFTIELEGGEGRIKVDPSLGDRWRLATPAHVLAAAAAVAEEWPCPRVSVGQTVEVVADGGTVQRGTVRTVEDLGFVVEWEENIPPMRISRSFGHHWRFVNPLDALEWPDPRVAVGQTVEVFVQGGGPEPRRGTVKALHGRGFTINWEDAPDDHMLIETGCGDHWRFATPAHRQAQDPADWSCPDVQRDDLVEVLLEGWNIPRLATVLRPNIRGIIHVRWVERVPGRLDVSPVNKARRDLWRYPVPAVQAQPEPKPEPAPPVEDRDRINVYADAVEEGDYLIAPGVVGRVERVNTATDANPAPMTFLTAGGMPFVRFASEWVTVLR